MNNENEIEVVVSSTDSNALAFEAGQRAALFKMTLGKLAECTSPSNWTDQGGKPFLDDNGCERMARVMGLGITEPVAVCGQEDDLTTGEKFYAVEMRGSAFIVLPNGTKIEMPQIGGCTSRDKFFQSNGSLKKNITSLDIKKKAYANYRGRCIRSFLGIGGLSWEELAEQGINRDGVKSVDFKQGKTSGKSEDADDVRKELGAMILSDANDNKTIAAAILEALTEFEGDNGLVKGKSSVKDLSDKQANYSWGNYREGGKGRKKYMDTVKFVHKEYGKKG